MKIIKLIITISSTPTYLDLDRPCISGLQLVENENLHWKWISYIISFSKLVHLTFYKDFHSLGYISKIF